MPEIDILLMSHDHYDHLDYGSIQKIKHKVKQFIMPLGVKRHFTRWGIPDHQIFELDWWQTITVDDCEIDLYTRSAIFQEEEWEIEVKVYGVPG
jgi:L-ascorbate metabolism protein UlaG (beta-lactamase superfamily)